VRQLGVAANGILLSSEHSANAGKNREELYRNPIPNPSHQFNFSPCNLCTVF